MWLTQKLNDIKAAVIHIFILCFLPNSIFFVVVVLSFLHCGHSKVTLILSTKYCQKGRETICPRIPQNTSLLVPLARIGSHDINAGVGGCWESESLPRLMEGRFCWKLKSGQKLEGRNCPLWCPIVSISRLKPPSLAMLRFGKARTQLLHKDSHRQTIWDGAQDQSQTPHHLMMSYFRAGCQTWRELGPEAVSVLNQEAPG